MEGEHKKINFRREPDRIRLHIDKSPISRLLYGWTRPVIDRARYEVLSSRDLGPPPDWVKTQNLTHRINHFRLCAKTEGRGWAWILFKLCQRDIVRGILCSGLAEVLVGLQPGLFKMLLDNLRKSNNGDLVSHWGTYGITVLIVVVLLLRLLAVSYCSSKIMDLSYITRSALIGSIYRKALRLGNGPRQKYQAGKGIQVISSDTSRVCSALMVTNFYWIIPLRTLFAFAYGYYYFGIYSLPAIAVVMLIIPILYWMAQMIRRGSDELNNVMDKRIGLTQETLQNVKVVKYLSLEDSSIANIEAFRKRELALLFQVNSLFSVAGAIDFWAPFFAAALSIAWYELHSQNIQPGLILSFVQTFGNLVLPLWLLPIVVGGTIKARTSLARIDHYLDSEEPSKVSSSRVTDIEAAIFIQDAMFQWDCPPPDPRKKKKRVIKRNSVELDRIRQSPFQLYAINVSIPHGSLVGVIGKSGAGKSSLLYAFLGEMRCRTGLHFVNGSTAICEQNTWLRQGTIKDNILFGSPLDEARYRQVIRECSLEKDLESFQFGDAAVVGEKGASVSGGQRQRLGLARAAYAQAEIVLLDDPLSAVDATVARHLFYKCIKRGILATKTRILTTHNVGYLADCDVVLVMDEGRIIASGSYSQLLSSDKKEMSNVRDLLLKSPIHTESQDTFQGLTRDFDAQSAVCTNPSAQDKETYREDVSRKAAPETLSVYVKALCGWKVVLFIGLLAVLTEVFNVWKEDWLCKRMKASASLLPKFTYYYVLLASMQGLFSALTAISAVWFCNVASEVIHRECLEKVMRAKMSVFDVTPIGRILNRFSRDLDFIDSNFPDRITQLLVSISSLISTILLLGHYYPQVLLSIALPLLGTYLVQRKFRKVWRQLQQISGISVGPIVSRFSESLSGLITIRTFHQQDRFIKEFDQSNDTLTYSAIWLLAVRRWASLRIETIWILYWGLMAIFFIWCKEKASVVGIVLKYISSTIESVDFSTRHLAELESCLISVERLYMYTHNLESDHDDRSQVLPPLEWPYEGRVEFDNVSVQYKPHLPLVISNFSFTFAPKTRIAIVGRSGAGKSTILAALFRYAWYARSCLTL